MKSPSILLSIVAAVTMTFGLSTSSVQAHDGSADLNHDGWVNSYDITILLADWGAVADGALHSDINNDFEVGAADFAILIGALGPVPPAVSCSPIAPSLGNKLHNVINTDQVLHVDGIIQLSDWNGYLICQNGIGPQALIQGGLTGPPYQFNPLALMSGEDDIVLSSDTLFTPSNKGTTQNSIRVKHTSDFLLTGIPLTFTPKLTSGYVLVIGTPIIMIFSYTGVTPSSTPNCTDSQCCLLTGCKLVGITGSIPPSYTGLFPDQPFNNGSQAIECTAPAKGNTVSNNPSSITVTPSSPSTPPFDLTVLSTAGFDPAGTFIVKSSYDDGTSTKILVSYTSTDSTTFIGCKAVVPSQPGAPHTFTIKAGMPISMTNSSEPYTIRFSDLSRLNLATSTSAPTGGYGIYAMGMATGSTAGYWLDLDVDPLHPNSMHFVPATCTGSTCYYPVNKINDLTTLFLDPNVHLGGARIYFFVLPLSLPTLPQIAIGTQPTLPPRVPFAFIEFTVPDATCNPVPPATGTMPVCSTPGYRIALNATFDVQQVDSFQFPMTMAWQISETSASDPPPTSNTYNNVIFGQKICSIHSQTDGSASRESILLAFDDFFPAAPSSPYRDLKLPLLPFLFPNATPQAAGILAPSHYLEKNVGSKLNTVFDSDLKTLFSTAANGLKIWGNQSDPAGIAESYYDVTFVNVPYPTDPPHLPAPHIPALKLTTSTSPPSGTATGQNNTFYIFSPTDTSIITTTSAGVTSPILGTLSQATSSSTTVTLTIQNPNSDLITALGSGPNAPGLGMYVFSSILQDDCSALGDWQVDDKSVIQIFDLSYTQSTSLLTITLSSTTPGTAGLCTVAHFQFSRQPFVANIKTSGNMVFSCDGLFTDQDLQSVPTTAGDQFEYRNVLSNLENQIVTALNRGVVVTPAIGKNPAKLTSIDSKDWSTQTGWYTPGTTYNEFSCFLHTAQIKNASGHDIPISYAPFNSRNSGGGFIMSAAYGFAFDESSQVGDLTLVPSKLDGTVTPGSIITFTFGPWIDSSCP